MTARMVRINDNYIAKFDEMVATFEDNIEIVDDQNLKLDPYFYERKASLDKTIKAIDDGTMKMISQEEYDRDMDIFMAELEQKYASN
ncbi:MAG: hypothetical protein RBT59_05985 [Arcobacteraceae bacterium]|jgi:hypothetical protein|nr:hypothetical protein [Arcobacteraceae bacterium]